LISQPGNYTLASDLTGTTGAPGGGCLLFGSPTGAVVSGVYLDCGGHSIMSTNANSTTVFANGTSNLTITNCVIQVGNPGSLYDASAIGLLNCQGTLVTGNVLTGIISNGGSNNSFLNNTIDGGWDGNLSDVVGSQQGVYLSQESNDVIQGNTIKNVTNYGVAGFGTVTNTIVDNNTIVNAPSGISVFAGTWTGNTASNNLVENAKFLFYIETLASTTTPIVFQGNQFVSNALVPGALGDPWESASIVLESTSPVTLGENLLARNDFGPLSPPYILPANAVTDGGGNHCLNPSSGAISCLPPIGAGARGPSVPGRHPLL
jgi:hypothetical protein